MHVDISECTVADLQLSQLSGCTGFWQTYNVHLENWIQIQESGPDTVGQATIANTTGYNG